MGFLDDYEPVEDRLRAFWSEHPKGRVHTELMTLDARQPGDVVIFRADVWRGDEIGPSGIIESDRPLREEDAQRILEAAKEGTGKPWLFGPGVTYRAVDIPPDATGYAHQRLLSEPPPGRNGKPNDSAPEWTSPWEVAETSAIGRALANLGYAAKGKRPSREEVSKAVRPVGEGGTDGGGAETGSPPSLLNPAAFEAMSKDELVEYGKSIGLTTQVAKALKAELELPDAPLDADGWRQVLTRFQMGSV